MSRDIYVVVEQRRGKLMKVSFELLGKAKELAKDLNQEVIAILMGNEIKSQAKELTEYGANKVLVVDDPMLKEYMTEPYAKTVCTIIKEKEPEIVLFAASAIGRDLAPRVSARVRTGLTADCTDLNIDEESRLLLMTRPAFGGNIMAVIVCENHRPQMATVRPGVMKPMEKIQPDERRVEEFPVSFEEGDRNVKICSVVENAHKVVDITEAPVLVAGGRGMREPEKFQMLRELARLLGGETAASRACVDAEWVDASWQVGQTGKTVRPKLYLACGISGAIQHVAGMEESQLIIAINKDENAPIFGISDLGIVGDLHIVVPKLIQKLQKRQPKG